MKAIESPETVLNRGDAKNLDEDPTTAPHQLIVNDEMNDRSPSVSPDGRQMVFVRNGMIYKCNLNLDFDIGIGCDDITPLATVGDNSNPCWLGTGGMILFASNTTGKDDIIMMDTDGSDAVNLTEAWDNSYEHFPGCRPSISP